MKQYFKKDVEAEKVADIILALIRIQENYADYTLSEEYKTKLDEDVREYWEKFYKMTEWR